MWPFLAKFVAKELFAFGNKSIIFYFLYSQLLVMFQGEVKEWGHYQEVNPITILLSIHIEETQVSFPYNCCIEYTLQIYFNDVIVETAHFNTVLDSFQCVFSLCTLSVRKVKPVPTRFFLLLPANKKEQQTSTQPRKLSLRRTSSKEQLMEVDSNEISKTILPPLANPTSAGSVRSTNSAGSRY